VQPDALTTAYRIADWVSPLWVNPNRGAGRWNRAGQTTQYFSLHPCGPWAEFARREHLAGDIKYFRHRLWVARLDLSQAVAIDWDTANNYGVTPEELVGDDWSPCQELADRLRDNGTQTLVVPSAALPGTRNVVIFGARAPSPFVSEPIDFVDVPAAIAAEDARASDDLANVFCPLGAVHRELDSWRNQVPFRFVEPQLNVLD
jgi:RES domain-containing protein